MSTELLLETERDKLRKHFIKYTREAFQILPRIKNPHILDVGCGSGIPTIELGKLSKGKITGIDIDQNLLDKLKERVKELGLSNQILIKKCSLFDIDLPKETFDIIWTEGSIHIIGFEKGLKEWKVLLKPGGFLVIHERVKAISTKLKKIPELGYELVKYFMLPADAWWTEYYQPLENLIKEWQNKAKNNKSIIILEKYQNEVNMFKRNPKEHASGFYILKKTVEKHF
jgi:ubiquinone/menaquinone biosynthesis C-methylase UbiE